METITIPKIEWKERPKHPIILGGFILNKSELTIFTNGEIRVNAEKTDKNQSF